MTLYAKIKDGIINYSNQKLLENTLLHFEGKNVRIEIEEDKPLRSLDQNALLWFYYRLVSQDTGDNEQDLHEYFKRKCLPPQFKKIMGVTVKLPASTKTLKKHEMSEYLDRISFLTNVPIPDTEEYKSLRNGKVEYPTEDSSKVAF